MAKKARKATRAKKALGPFAAAHRRRNRAWAVAGLSVGAFIVAAVAVSQKNGLTHHPVPRATADQSHVVGSARYAEYPRVAQSYEMAAAVPAVLDGLYCYCNCGQHAGHYSLLDCFDSDHAARCDVCMSEAVIAYQMTQNGASLDEVRREVDRTYGA